MIVYIITTRKKDQKASDVNTVLMFIYIQVFYYL